MNTLNYINSIHSEYIIKLHKLDHSEYNQLYKLKS